MSHATDPELSGRHPVNIGHLVMGLAFVGLVGVWALIQGDIVQGDDIRWLLPVPWVLAGIAVRHSHQAGKPENRTPKIRATPVRLPMAASCPSPPNSKGTFRPPRRAARTLRAATRPSRRAC